MWSNNNLSNYVVDANRIVTCFEARIEPEVSGVGQVLVQLISTLLICSIINQPRKMMMTKALIVFLRLAIIIETYAIFIFLIVIGDIAT